MNDLIRKYAAKLLTLLLDLIKKYAADLIILAGAIAISTPINMYAVSREWYELPALGWFGTITTIFALVWILFGYMCRSSLKWEMYALCAGSLMLVFGISTELTNSPLPLNFRTVMVLVAFFSAIFGTMGSASESRW